MTIILQTERLTLRNWRNEDRDLFREINRDEKVMEFFPMRRSHAECDELMNRLQAMIDDTGYGFFAVADRQTDEAMGFCGISRVSLPGILPEGAVEIGWRLATRFWGQGYVTEAARALLDLGFKKRGLDEIYAFAVEGNHRSIAVMERLGMERLAGRDFNHPSVPDTHPHLKNHVLYCLKAS
ncbi:GNAT family N-acetyltransferase [Rhizobium sp. AG855]|uniref:GNAT family N-acetyltransferase n=1 Tax=Rhizobium sp. AG855 TaxID=2183898 RepID=UPI000E7345DA|nr:GNAT family N-acetyltransferase [Rhizobium sp. AG855]RKE84362.1 RimJ/RimL family protein N-acetyltransferase [Rhizobium sp. AG855]